MEIGDLATWVASLVAVLALLFLVINTRRERARAGEAEQEAFTAQRHLVDVIDLLRQNIDQQRNPVEGKSTVARILMQENRDRVLDESAATVDRFQKELDWLYGPVSPSISVLDYKGGNSIDPEALVKMNRMKRPSHRRPEPPGGRLS